MGLYHPLRTTGVKVTLVVLCLLLLNGFTPRLLPGWLFKPVFGWSWFGILQQFPTRPPRGYLGGLLCVTGYIQDAVSETEKERTHVEAEHEAFTDFADSVRAMDAGAQPAYNSPTVTLASATPAHEQLRTVQKRYRETIMSIPGYETEYGESLRENMSAEFGEDVTAAVLDGNQFTPQLRNMLVTQANNAAADRRRLLEAVDDEQHSLEDAYRRIEASELSFETWSEIELAGESFGALLAYDRETHRKESKCTALLEDRQREIQKQNRWLPRSDASVLQEHLYRNLETRFPVLRAGVERVKQIRDRRHSVGRMIARVD